MFNGESPDGTIAIETVITIDDELDRRLRVFDHF